ncbi:ImmA/IrrE family metallo-endopeptidase [Nocardioides sp. zg-578]|nr:ImmA/IrrE family metallo-endopeptidase [Nocardioides marmotae]
MDVDTASARIGVKAERVREWEAGETDPTINQLRAMSDAYDRPLAALFMSEPPAEDDRRSLPDFRRPAVRETATPRALQKAVMRAYRQQDALRDIAEELDLGSGETDASFSLDPTAEPSAIGAQLRDVLGMESISKSTLMQPDVFLRELVRRAEGLNVTVIQVQRVPTSEMRGFSLGRGPSPIVALNGADWPRGKVYTLLHELAHVGFRTDGLCDLQQVEEAELERTCDEVAAAALMPADAMSNLAYESLLEPPTLELCRAIGNEHGASGEAALLRLIDLELATWDDYWRLKPEFDAAYAAFKADEKDRNAGKDSPIFYQVKARDLGRRFIRQMLTAHGEEALSSRDLAQLLEVSYDKVPKLAGMIGQDF